MGVNTIYVLVGVAVVYWIMHVRLLQRYSETKDKPSLYLGLTANFFALPAIFGILIAVATAVNNLPLAAFFFRCSTTSGILAYVFLNAFAIALAKPKGKMWGIWISVTSFFVIAFIMWSFNPTVEGVIDGTTEFTLTSTYKAPYGLPLIETIIALMTAMAIYPIYLFFRIAEDTKERIIRIKSILMGIGLIIADIAYSIEVTDAISYQYMPIYRPTIFIGSLILSFSYVMPKQLERILAGHALVGAESVESFVEQFFVHPDAQSAQSQCDAFSRKFGLKHEQTVGRKILLEFDPGANYEKAVQDLATEALANIEPIVVFTRRGSAIHASLSGEKAVKFLCLTQQVSVPKELSENEMLVPSDDTSLILDVFDKTLRAHPHDAFHVVFDSLSDLVLSIGFEKTYRFTKYATEMLVSPRITALFLLNQSAHDIKVVSNLRSLFNNQITYGKGGIETVKLPEAEIETGNMKEALVKEEK